MPTQAQRTPIASWSDGDAIEGYRSARAQGAATGPQRQLVPRSRPDRRQRLDQRQGVVRFPGARRRLRSPQLRRHSRPGQGLPRAASGQRSALPRGQRIRPRARLRRSPARADDSRRYRRSLRPPRAHPPGNRYAVPCCRRLGLETLAAHGRAVARAPGRQVDPPRVPRRPAGARRLDGRAGAQPSAEHYPRSSMRTSCCSACCSTTSASSQELGAMPANDYTRRGTAGRAHRPRPRPPARALRGHRGLSGGPCSSISSIWSCRTTASSSSARRCCR